MAGRAAIRETTAAALGAAALCLALASCGPEDPPAYPYVADRPRVLFATADGLSATRPEGAAAPALASIAHNASILTADARSIVAAVNGSGYARIEAAPPGEGPRKRGGGATPGGRESSGGAGRGRADGVAYRVVNVPLPSSFAGLTTGGIWPSGSGFILQLYRDPFFSGSGGAAQGKTAGRAVNMSASTPKDEAPRALLLEIGAAFGERALPCPEAGEGFELFALFPSRGRWLGEQRREGPDSVDLAFFEAEAPLGAGTARSVGREVFEAALAPLPLLSLQGLEGAALRSALGALGPGPFMARLRSAEGADAWYLSGGKAEDAAQAWAWSLGGGRVIALSSAGRLSVAGAGPTRAVELGSPYGGASYTALACAGDIVAAAWEAGSFPEIAAAGLVIAPLGR